MSCILCITNGDDTWTLTEIICKKIEVFEMWLYRRILKIVQIDYNTNQCVFESMGKEKELLTTMKYRKLEYMGHLRSNQQYNVLQLILQEKRNVGRGQISFSELKNPRDCYRTRFILDIT